MSAVKTWLEDHISEFTDEDLFEMGLDRETIDSFRGIEREEDEEAEMGAMPINIHSAATRMQRIITDILTRKGRAYVEDEELAEVNEDFELTEVEKMRLHAWDSRYQMFTSRPFDEYHNMVREVLTKGTLNVEDAKDILWNCGKILDASPEMRQLYFYEVLAC